MKIKKLTKDIYTHDEFGRIVIEDEDILENISGAQQIFDNDTGANLGCGANRYCPNWRCDNGDY